MIVAPRKSRLLQAALAYAARNWPVLPVWWVQAGKCACPQSDCDRAGKHPITAGGVHDATTDPATVEAWWAEHPRAHVGVALGAPAGDTQSLGIVALDVDPRNGGHDTLDALEDQLGRLPETVTSDTGGGGRHLFFQRPAAASLLAKLGPGVELQREGQYVVAPPSGHATGGSYSWHAECAPDEIEPAELPAAWVDALTRPDAPVAPAPPCDIPLEQREARCRRYVAKMPTAISGEGGHDRTFAVARVIVRGFQIPLDRARVILEEYSQRCKPPWRPREIEHKLEQAQARALVPWGYLLTGRTSEYATPAGPAPGGETPERIELTDTGNALRFVKLFKGQIVYCDDSKTWRSWDGQRWAPNAESRVLELTSQVAREILLEGAQIIDDTQRRRMIQHGLATESARARKAIVTLAAVERGMSVPTHGQFDRDPWLLNVANGTIDLRTASLRRHDPNDWITQVAPVEYDPRATCPRWLRFLDEVFAGSEPLVGFMQRLVGYSITGDTSVHGLYVLWGEGSNGKSTLLTTLLAMLGHDYAKSLQPDLLLSRTQRSSAQDEQVADLRGTRLAAMQETDRGQRLAEATVKMLTSNDEIVAVRKFEHPVRFTPTHKAWFATNHKPAVPGGGHGIWRRIHLIPFTQRFVSATGEATAEPASERNGTSGTPLDPRLPARLADELPGILTWAVEGCLEFQRRGSLEPPPEVLQATEEYRQDEDLVGRFLDECCVVREGAWAAVADLSGAWKAWTEELGERRARTSDLWEELTRRGCQRTRSGSGRMNTLKRGWSGVGIIAPMHDQDESYSGF